jgi:hypothetical protein
LVAAHASVSSLFVVSNGGIRGAGFTAGAGIICVYGCSAVGIAVNISGSNYIARIRSEIPAHIIIVEFFSDFFFYFLPDFFFYVVPEFFSGARYKKFRLIHVIGCVID